LVRLARVLAKRLAVEVIVSTTGGQSTLIQKPVDDLKDEVVSFF
jgi:hypothetical protein